MGEPLPEDMIKTIRQDPRFKDIMKTRSTDPDLYEFEDVVLNYNKDVDRMKDISQKIDLDEFDVTGQTKHAEGGRIGYSGGGHAGLPAITQGMPPGPGMQQPQMPAGPQPAGMTGGMMVQNQMQQSPWMGQNPNMKQGIGGMPRAQMAGGGMCRRAFMKLL